MNAKTTAPTSTVAVATLPTAAELKDKIIRHLHGTLGTDVNKASPQAWWRADLCCGQ